MRRQGENEYANWVQAENEAYRSDGIKRLTDGTAQDERATSALDPENVKSAKWKLAVDLTMRTKNIESNIHAVERVPSEVRGKPAQFTPIRFVFTNKLSRHDKLLLAFDGLVLSETLGREVGHGKIIHGDAPSTLVVKTSALASEVRKITAKISTLLATEGPPDLVLNRHCAECEFQTQCRKKATDKDDLRVRARITSHLKALSCSSTSEGPCVG